MSAASPPAPSTTTTPVPTPAMERLSGEAVRQSMNRVVVAWAFGAVFYQLSAGAIYASFARQLGASDSVFGFLAGVYPLMGFLQILAARLLEFRASPRTVMLCGGLCCRVMWVIAASLPLINLLLPVPLTQPQLLNAFVGCLLLSSIGQAFVSPSFFSWMSTLLPKRVVPSFWGRRYQVGTVASIFAVIAGGYVADHAEWIRDASHGQITPLLTHSLLLLVAALCGIVDIVAFFFVSEPPRKARTEKLPSLWQSLREPIRERPVRRYLTFTVVHVIGTALAGPLLWLFCLEWLGFDKTRTGLLLTICPLLGMAVSSKWWGGIAKTHGTRPLLRIASMGLIIVPVSWILALPSSTLALAVMLFASGTLLAPFEISNLSFVTRTCPHIPRPTLTALFSICTGTTFALASWGAGGLAQSLKGFHLEIGGFSFINYHLIFAFSLVPRLLNALVLAPRLDEPGATNTREMLKQLRPPKWRG